ncbi:gamma-mobile-trio integrase GmtZ [Halopseudomonas yangmingensis]|uniref:Phage integrase family protein n=1 Tax=Halopseudomonas yangmingensis TaxID=1720063 RepID=A0A1I4SZ97_9GAMM|nr:VPA1269 family protein [Halopseudomonas yangmingensis]SFM69741.1 Phage integrase family protein [Halopseudomonas yangmingensis]
MKKDDKGDFIGAPVSPSNLDELKSIIRENGINNSPQYRRRYKDIPGLPAHPERVFSEEWKGYVDFFDIPDLISYKKLKKEVIASKIGSKKAYISWVNSLNNDARYPRAPEEAYGEEWEDWYEFCGKEKPYQLRYISEPYKLWADKIEEFMRQALGGGSKINNLCRFVRMYIEKHEKSKSPQEFLTKEKVNIRPFRKELDLLPTDNYRRNVIIAVNEFLNFVIENDLTDEDEDTGEIVRVMNARNPFQFMTDDKSVTSPVRGESTKPCLQYYFVRRCQDWIVPKNAKTFKDLVHLQKFDTDWISVPRKLIDKKDPDCVYRERLGEYQIWCPIDWIHTYALTKVPLRGRQISYNDSGEGDNEIAEIGPNGSIIWVKNTGGLAGTTKAQSFIKKMSDGNIGMYVTTNKTSNNGAGYSIPWIPEDLAYWLVRLRKWQQKYNSISEATPWTRCVRTNLNELQLRARGVNCFLFRAFGDVEPKNPSLALTTRLAAALYHIQPASLKLAEVNGTPYRLSNYKSKYTPHSMRVSLITAYVMEYGLPIEVVMKIVGHSSIVMSIYYCKINHTDIRQRLEEAEKKALKSQAEATQALIEQNQIESVKNQLVGSNQDLLRSLTNDVPAGNYVFRDYGICPYAASRCDDGGEEIAGSKVRSPAPAGYLGIQNCLRCRHFITGPVFLGGLLSITNEVLFEANEQSAICDDLQVKIQNINTRLSDLDRQEYLAQLKNKSFDYEERKVLEFKIRKLESEYESAAKKFDMLLCDLQSSYKLIQLSQSVANGVLDSGESSLQLIKMPESEIKIEVEESSHFQQLHEICENATIYESCNPSRAVFPRSQLLDRMATFNDMAPGLFLLSKEEQLVVGNQLVALFKTRVGSWGKINSLINGDLKLCDLVGPERIELSEIELIRKRSVQEIL